VPLIVRAATRGSALARWQTDHVAALLRAVDPDIVVEVVVVETAGDRRQDIPIWQMGGKGVFVKEVQAAVLEGRADIAVHSAKDLPSETHPGLMMAAVPERADARDVLVGSSLDGLAPGAVVATGSVRRRSQLAWARPDLTFSGLRGNIDTRLAKAPGFGAIVMALAPLHRLGLFDQVRGEHTIEVLEPAVMLPQVGQGALAIECRVGDDADGPLGELWRGIEHGPSRRALDAERGFLSELGGDCDLPAGAHATTRPDGGLRIEGLIASLDGHTVLRHVVEVGPAADGGAVVAAGREVGRYLLHDAGGAALLDR
jgi:hydroxymethylbilane synthase